MAPDPLHEGLDGSRGGPADGALSGGWAQGEPTAWPATRASGPSSSSAISHNGIMTRER